MFEKIRTSSIINVSLQTETLALLTISFLFQQKSATSGQGAEERIGTLSLVAKNGSIMTHIKWLWERATLSVCGVKIMARQSVCAENIYFREINDFSWPIPCCELER